MLKGLSKLILLVDEIAPISDEEELIEYFLAESSKALVGIGILMVAIVIVMIIASKVGLEDFDYIDYFVMSLGIFVLAYLLYVILVILLNGMIHQGVFTFDDILLMRLFVFLFSIVFLFGPLLLILKASFMFMKPRLILAGIYAFMIATGFSLVILIS